MGGEYVEGMSARGVVGVSESGKGRVSFWEEGLAEPVGHLAKEVLLQGSTGRASGRPMVVGNTAHRAVTRSFFDRGKGGGSLP